MGTPPCQICQQILVTFALWGGVDTLPETNKAPETLGLGPVGRWVSFLEGLLPVAMLVLGSVLQISKLLCHTVAWWYLGATRDPTRYPYAPMKNNLRCVYLGSTVGDQNFVVQSAFHSFHIFYFRFIVVSQICTVILFLIQVGQSVKTDVCIHVDHLYRKV